MPRPSNGDHVNKTHQASQKHNEDQHGDEVNNQQPADAPEGSDEAGDGNNKDNDAEKDDRPLEDLDAGIVLLGGQPYSGADDGDGEEHGYEIYSSDYCFGECHFWEAVVLWE